MLSSELSSINAPQLKAFAFDGIDNPSMISIFSDTFFQKYKIKKGTVLITKEDYLEGNIVLICVKSKYYITKFSNDNFIDCKDKNISFTLKNEDIVVVGSVFSKIERF
ncbi:MAG: hypothetical protein LBU51_01670 [Bacteroidales bacterium]|jgi:hypothetical protein|nr:hypothetical protein [Bacteroidales bacterium]